MCSAMLRFGQNILLTTIWLSSVSSRCLYACICSVDLFQHCSVLFCFYIFVKERFQDLTRYPGLLLASLFAEHCIGCFLNTTIESVLQNANVLI